MSTTPATPSPSHRRTGNRGDGWWEGVWLTGNIVCFALIGSMITDEAQAAEPAAVARADLPPEAEGS